MHHLLMYGEASWRHHDISKKEDCWDVVYILHNILHRALWNPFRSVADGALTRRWSTMQTLAHEENNFFVECIFELNTNVLLSKITAGPFKIYM